MRQQELTFQLTKDQLSKENEELKTQLGDLDLLKEKASQDNILNLDFVDQQRQFYVLSQRYTDQSRAATMFRKDAEVAQNKVQELDGQLRQEKIRPPAT
jgi:hypothetical protein